MPEADQSAMNSVHIASNHALRMAGDTYLHELMAFHDMVRDSVADEVDLADWLIPRLEFLSGEDRVKLHDLMSDFIDAVTKAADYIRRVKNGEKLEPFEEVRIASGTTEAGIALGHIAIELTQRVLPNREQLTSRAFLVTAVSSFEILFSKVVRCVYDRNPTALSKSDHAFTLEELSQFSSIEEARQALVSQKIDSLLRESVDAWLKWLQRTTNLDMSEAISFWPEVREIFARRNILVHADGCINQQYIEALQRASMDTSQLVHGEKVPLTTSYLKDSLEKLLAFGILLVFAVWTKLYKAESGQAIGWVLSCQTFLIHREMWLAISLISAHLESAKCSRAQSLSNRIDGWLAGKHLHGPDSIREAVEAWDISGLSHRYRMTKCLLLNLHDEAKKHVIFALRTRQLTRFEVATNPLFSDFRLVHPLGTLSTHEGVATQGDDPAG